MSVDETKLSRAQRDWLRRLRLNPAKRLKYGAPGCPQQTADGLIKLGLAKLEMLPILVRKPDCPKAMYIVPVE